MALYMRSRSPSGKGSFAKISGVGSTEVPVASAGDWERFCNSSDFLDRRSKLGSSYLIDQVIQQLANDYKSGAMIVGQDLGLAWHADAFSTLASETRMARLLIGDALADVINEDPRIFWSAAVESPGHPTVMYVWLIYPPPPDDLTDDDIEVVVGQELEKYVFVAMGKFAHAQRFFGIALANTRSNRTSRLFRFAERKVWDEGMQLAAEALSRDEGIFADIESSVHAVIRPV